MILIGLGGEINSDVHAKKTVDALNKMQPRLLSALRVIPIPGTDKEAEEKGCKTAEEVIAENNLKKED